MTTRHPIHPASGRGIARQIATSRLEDAERLLENAKVQGGYERYEKAMMAFDRLALSGDGDVRAAKKGSQEARLAYARAAMINRDFDLVDDLVDPLLGVSLEAAHLQRRSAEKRLSAKLGITHHRLFYPLLAIIVVMVSSLGYNIWRSMTGGTGEPAYLVEKVQRTLTTAAVTSVQSDYLTVWEDLQRQPHRLARYKSYEPVRAMFNGAYSGMLSTHGRFGEERQALYENFVAELPLILGFYNELITDPDSGHRGASSRLAMHLRQFSEFVIQYRDRQGQWIEYDGEDVGE